MSGVGESLLHTAEGLAQSHGLYVLGSLEKPVKPGPLKSLLESLGTTRVSLHRGPGAQQAISEQELVSGLAGDAVEVVFQPQVRIKDRQVVGVEALARWRHPERGLLGPGAFIPLAEERGHMDALTEAVLCNALAAGADWMSDGLELQVSVNLSADSLKDLSLPDRVVACAEEQGFRPGLVTLELTETRIMQDLRSATEILARLRLKGVGLAVDDFGTGFSSMDQLRRAPFTELKIDRAFVHGAGSDATVVAILESSISLGNRLGLTMVAEGVEDQRDWDAVAAAGCHVVQGYFVARPMDAAAVPEWVARWAGAG